MSCLKFSLTLFVLAFAVSSSVPVSAKNPEKFGPKECLMAKYDAAVEHKGDFWGLLKSELAVKKDVCKIVVLDQGLLDNEWKVDVCREPVHIKAVTKGSLSVHKRTGACESGAATASEYCESLERLLSVLEDKGLIFAEGEREKLSTAHGKIYCAYLLLKNHLEDGVLFSKYEEPLDIYKAGIGSAGAMNGDPKRKAQAPESKAPKQGPGKKEKVEAQGRF